MTGKNAQTEAARERILHVAAEMFVEHGLQATSVRKICERAQVNVAMVNYYFHSKEALYLAVFDYARLHRESGEDVHAADAALPPELRLKNAIERMTVNLLAKSGPASLFLRLMSREQMEPTANIVTIAERDVRLQHAYFHALVRAIVGERLSDAEVRNCVLSIIGQAIFYARSRPVHELAVPEVTYDDAGARRIASHIYRFSMAALEHLQSDPLQGN